MSKPLLLLVFMLFNILTYGSTSDANTADFRNSKGPKPLYGMIKESSKIQRTSPVQHAVQETSSSRLAKAGGAGSAGSYTYTAPKTTSQQHSRRSASCSIKPPSFFMAAIFGLLLVTRFF